MAANPTSVLAVIDQPLEAGVVTWNLDEFPADRFNRLLPMQTIAIPNDLFKPAYQVIIADPPDREGKSADTYKSTDVPNGHRAPTARLLRKFATAAGITFSDEHRLDDGTNPDVLGVTMQASMVLPSGQRVSAPGSQLIDIKTWFRADSTPAEIAKFRKQFYANVATRAMNRAIRGLLGLRSSYPEGDLAKPFLVVSYVLNMNHQDVRARVLDAFMPMTAQLYGGAPIAPKQLASGEVTVAEAAEDDPAPSTPPVMPGERLAAAQGSDVAGDDALPAWATDQPAADAEPTLLARIRDTAEAGGMVGGAKKPQLEALGEIFGPLKGRATVGGLQALWPDMNVNAPTANQAQAIIGVSRTYETPEAFQAAWREMTGIES